MRVRVGGSAGARGAFTLIELLVCIGIVAVLAGVSLGVFEQGRQRAAQIACVSNLRQWGLALNLYANDHDNYFAQRGQGIQPLDQVHLQGTTFWFNALPPYAGQPGLLDAINGGRAPRPGDRSIFVCPSAVASARGPYFLPYGMNMYLSPTIRPLPHSRLQIGNPAQVAFLADGGVAWSSAVPSAQGYSVQARHGGRANVCFVDGHVAAFDGAYLGCGVGQPDPERDDVHWRVDAGGINQPPVP